MWYNETVFYQIYISSFKDGNNDGIGDFKGIIQQLDYLQELGIKGVWITPFYPSPKVDNGYDISDYCDIDKTYGTMGDFETLIEEAHKRGIKVITDIVINHTSDQHEWFKESRKSKDNKYRDYYIWKKEVPNNWESFFAGSAWEYDELTEEYYYHAFAKEQACLNWTNREVMQEVLNILKFWLDKGVDGFRFDVINFLKCNEEFIHKNNEYNSKNELEHKYDKDQDGVLDVIREITIYIRQWDNKFLVGEVGNEDLQILSRYQDNNLLNVVFNFNLGSIEEFNLRNIYNQIQQMEACIKTPTIFFSSHDMSRHISRLCGNDADVAKVFATMILTLRGIPFIYQGDEIGMQDFVAKDIDEIIDIQGRLNYQIEIDNGTTKEIALNKALEKCRDKSRTPIQWDKNKLYYGFSETKPWLNINDNGIDVETQFFDTNSILNTYKKLIHLRNKHISLNQGMYKNIEVVNNVLFYTRQYKKEKVFIILNFGDDAYDYSIDEGYELLFATDSPIKSGTVSGKNSKIYITNKQ